MMGLCELYPNGVVVQGSGARDEIRDGGTQLQASSDLLSSLQENTSNMSIDRSNSPISHGTTFY